MRMYMMKVISETRRAHPIRYLHFYADCQRRT